MWANNFVYHLDSKLGFEVNAILRVGDHCEALGHVKAGDGDRLNIVTMPEQGMLESHELHRVPTADRDIYLIQFGHGAGRKHHDTHP